MPIFLRTLVLANLAPGFHCTFEMFTNGFTQYVSPTQVYLLALVFRFLPPSILIARIFAAFWVFAACLVLGLLARRISGQIKIGVIVTATALLTPWFFDIRGLLLEPHFVPFAFGSFPHCPLRCSSKGELDLAHCCVARWRASASYLLLYKRPPTRSLASSWPHLVCDQCAATNRCYSDMVIVRLNAGSDILI